MIKTAILGFGTVGSGVAEVLTMNADSIKKTVGEEIELKYIVDVRDFPEGPYTTFLTKDFSVVENDPEVKIVAEAIGGATVAYDFTKRALLAGKSVVTSNKELVAKHGRELLAIAKEKNVNYLFEASVGGGIPILRPITQCLAGNKISEIYGILNGTTNYILTQMIQNGSAFEDALKQAQANGYAEANPAADIEGTDACRKICILSDLCFGKEVRPDQVPTEGITKITLDDVAVADKAGYKIKLLGRALDVDGKTAAYVAPHLVPVTNLIADVDDVMNGIMVVGNAIGNAMFYGAGAGKLPTASAVVGDIIDAAQHIEKRKDISWEEGGDDCVYDAALLESKWYVRLGGAAPEGAEVLKSEGDEVAAITAAMSKYDIDKALAGREVKALIRVLD